MSRSSSSKASGEVTAQLRDLSAFQAFTASLGQEESEQRAAQLVASALISLWGDPLSAVALRLEAAKGGWEFHGHIKEAPLDARTVKNLRLILTPITSVSNPVATTVPGPKLPVALRQREVKALHVLPVRTLEDQLGVLLLGTCNSKPLSAEREALLSALANHLAIALANARLRRALREQSLRLEDTVKERTAELESLVEIAQAVSAHLDRDHLFHAVAGAVGSIVSFDRIGIILPRIEKNDLLLYAFETQKGHPHLQPGLAFPQEGTVPSWVLEHKQPFIGNSLEDLGPFPVSAEVMSREGMQSSCVLPLLVEDRAVGALIFHSKEPGQYNPSDLTLLEEVAAVVALAVDNSLAYEEIKQLKDRLTQENIYLQEEIKTEYNFEEIVGRSR